MTELPGNSHRYTISYDGSRLVLVSTRSVSVRAPVSDDLDWEDGAVGFWVVLEDARGAVLYRRRLHNPLLRSREGFRVVRGPEVGAVDGGTPRGLFPVVVPDLPGARAVVIHGSLEAQDGSFPPASELARLDVVW